jgi:hypothetical protein
LQSDGKFEEKLDALDSPAMSPRKPAAASREGPTRIIQTRFREPILPMMPVPIVTQSEIDEKVRASITASLAGFLERARAETMKEVQNRLKVLDIITSKIDGKIERDFVERMFNKFRVVIAELKTKIEDVQATFMGWVTREELEQVLGKFAESLAEIKDTAGAASKYRCLLCGQPRTHISGMLLGELDTESQGEPDVKSTRSKSRAQSPALPRPKRAATPIARDVVQLLTTDAV